MQKILLILSLLVIVFGTIDAAPKRSSSLVNTDAKELADLLEKIWSIYPDDEKNVTKQLCQIAKQCCPMKAYLKILALANLNISVDTAVGVIGSFCLKSSNRSDIAKKCPSALKLTSWSSSSSLASSLDKLNIFEDPELFLVVLRMSEYQSTMDNFLNSRNHVCNINENYAISCMSNKKLVQSCSGKIIQQKIDPRDKKAYKAYVEKVKKAMTDLHLVMKKAYQSSNKKTLPVSISSV